MDFLNDKTTSHFLNKKLRRVKSKDKIKSKDSLGETTSTKDQDILDISTEISNSFNETPIKKYDNNFLDQILNEMYFPTFLNDITKYNNINKKIENYNKLKKSFKDEEAANLYLIDINRLYEVRKRIQKKH